jgi:hypothetical protein
MDIYPTSAEHIRAVPFELPIIGVPQLAAGRAARWFEAVEFTHRPRSAFAGGWLSRRRTACGAMRRCGVC